MFIVFLILGILCEIVNANGWFVIPNAVECICFGVAILIAIIEVIIFLTTSHNISKINKRF